MDSKQRSVAKTALKIDAAQTCSLRPLHLPAVGHQGRPPKPPETDWIGPEKCPRSPDLGAPCGAYVTVPPNRTGTPSGVDFAQWTISLALTWPI